MIVNSEKPTLQNFGLWRVYLTKSVEHSQHDSVDASRMSAVTLCRSALLVNRYIPVNLDGALTDSDMVRLAILLKV